MAGLGLVEYDGNGSAAGRFSGTWGGMAAGFDFVDLKYAVNRDCTGATEYKLKNIESGRLAGPDRHKCVVLEDGDLIRCMLLEASGRTVINSTELRRMNRGSRVCDSSVLRGSYGVHYDAWVNMQAFNPSQPVHFAPATGVGIGHIDLHAGSSGTATHIFGGIRIDTEIASLSLEVNSDCTGSMEYTALNKTMGGILAARSPIVVLNNGEKFIALNVDAPGFVHYIRVGMQ
jgi:hypothetical protein